MFRKIMTIAGLLAACAVFSGYFYCVNRYGAQQTGDLCCRDIKVMITNPQPQNFISEEQVAAMVRDYALGSRIDELNIHSLENLLCTSSAICASQVYIEAPATLTLEVTQRNPTVRFQTPKGGFYCDSSGFILPLLGRVTLNLPTVAGSLPFSVPEGGSGYPAGGLESLRALIGLCNAIRTNAYWSREVEQIWIEPNSDIVLYTKSCSEKFILGSADDAQSKLKKMAGYYRTIRPQAAANGKTYSTVNLKFKNQIICR